MRRREPYTPVKIYIDGLPSVAPWHFITTEGESAYLVQQVRPSPSIERRRYLSCLRWPIDDIPVDAQCFILFWYARGRKRHRG